jgi:hypothetical protein
LNHRKKGILKVVLFSILLVSYILGFVVVFNLRQILGIGNYEGEKNFNIDINGNSCGLNVELYARYQTGVNHYFGYKLTEFSSGDVGLVGISNMSFRLETGSSLKQVVYRSLNPPRITYAFDSDPVTTNLNKNDNLTIEGYANVIFTVNNVNETQKISINIGIIIKYDGGEIFYFWDLVVIWLEVIYLGLTAIPFTLLYRSIKRMRFEKWYSEEIQDRDDNFKKILSQKKKYED